MHIYIKYFNLQSVFISIVSFDPHENPVSMGQADLCTEKCEAQDS